MPLTLPIFQCRPAALVSRHPLREFPLTQNRAHKAPSLISLILHENPEFASLLSKKPVNPVIFSWMYKNLFGGLYFKREIGLAARIVGHCHIRYFYHGAAAVAVVCGLAENAGIKALAVIF